MQRNKVWEVYFFITTICSFVINEWMNGELGNHPALEDYAGPGTTLANRSLCRIDRSTCWPAVQHATTVLRSPTMFTVVVCRIITYTSLIWNRWLPLLCQSRFGMKPFVITIPSLFVTLLFQCNAWNLNNMHMRSWFQFLNNMWALTSHTGKSSSVQVPYVDSLL